MNPNKPERQSNQVTKQKVNPRNSNPKDMDMDYKILGTQ